MDPDDDNLTSPQTTEYVDYPDLFVRSYNEDNNGGSIIQNVSITIFSLVFILGIIGNGLVIWIAGFRMKKTISAVWFLHLAIADFLCCAFLPLNIARLAGSDMCVFSTIIFCSLDLFLFYVNLSASVLLLTAMSIDRWVSVMWPLWYEVQWTQKLVRITAGIIWLLSLVLGVLMSFLLELLLMDSLFSFGSSPRKINTELFWLVILFVIPFLIIVTSYFTIILKLRKSKRPQRSQRPYRIITAVTLCFFICSAPFYIWPVIDLSYPYRIKDHIVDIITTVLAYLNSCINPIIYVSMGQDSSHGFLRSIPFRVENALSDPPDEPCTEQEGPEPAPNKEV